MAERITKNRALNPEQGNKTVTVISNLQNNIKFTVWHSSQPDKNSVNTTVKHTPNNTPMEIVINGKQTLHNHENVAMTEVDEDLWNAIVASYSSYPLLQKDANGNAQIYAIKSGLSGVALNSAMSRAKDLPRNITDPLNEDIRKDLYGDNASKAKLV